MACPLTGGFGRSSRGSVLGSRASPRRTASTIASPHFDRSKPSGQRAQAREALDRRRRLHRDVADDVVLEHATARHVALLCFALAPGGDLDQHGELLGLAHPRLQALPGVLGLEAIGRGRGQHLHLLAHPVAAAALVEIGGELEVDVAQVGDVGDRVGELRLAQRPPRPIGEAVRLVEAVAGDALHELVIGDGIAVAQHHGGDLGIDDGARDDAGLVPAYLDVLPGGMEHLDDVLVRHQREEGSEVDAVGERVDDHRPRRCSPSGRRRAADNRCSRAETRCLRSRRDAAPCAHRHPQGSWSS